MIVPRSAVVPAVYTLDHTAVSIVSVTTIDIGSVYLVTTAAFIIPAKPPFAFQLIHANDRRSQLTMRRRSVRVQASALAASLQDALLSCRRLHHIRSRCRHVCQERADMCR